jgi:alpha-D-xyloside xylohydrolase
LLFLVGLGRRFSTDLRMVKGQFYSPAIVRVLRFPKGRDVAKNSLIVLPPKQKGMATISSGRPQVLVNGQTGQASFRTAQGQPLLSVAPPLSC